MNRDLFISEVSKLGINVTDEIMCKLDKFYELLVFWNEKINLTTIIDKESVYLKHFLDSSSFGYIYKLTNEKILDIGTGAGFPGVVLKILYPSIELTLDL